MQIEVDFEVWKELTARRVSEATTYNDVLRKVLNLGAGRRGRSAESGYFAAGRFLPNGSKLRATYKGEEFQASVDGAKIVGADGRSFGSLSAAAKAITENNVNGLRFWRVQRPGDDQWLLVTGLPITSR